VVIRPRHAVIEEEAMVVKPAAASVAAAAVFALFPDGVRAPLAVAVGDSGVAGNHKGRFVRGSLG